LTNDKKLYVNNTSEFDLQNIDELLGSVPESTISLIPTEITGVTSSLPYLNFLNSGSVEVKSTGYFTPVDI
jgi:hypothetical protein